MYCEEWLLVNQNRVKESTIAKYSVAVHNHIKPFFGKYLPEMITTGMTADFMNRMISEKHLSAKTAKDAAIVLKAILKYIARTEKSVELVEVTMPRYVAKETRVLSLEEQQRFIEYLSTQTDSCKFGILFALMTGLRIGEVCALRIRDVSLADRTVTVHETMQRIKNLDGKGSKTKIIFTEPKSITSTRIVPLTNLAYALCAEQVANSPPDAFLLTGSETKIIEPRVLQYRIKKYSEACGIEG